nr:PREDICTED: sodium- and chloride-dependent glycine transporter 2-like [Apteryx mantelli mantelli]
MTHPVVREGGGVGQGKESLCRVNIFQAESLAAEPSPGPPAPAAPRDTWSGKHEFLLSCLGYCVGLGNVWRFPYLCYRNGGGVFLIPYFIMLLLAGLPLFLLELSLGQYGAAGPIAVWKCCPLLKGIGVGMLLVSSLVSLYYAVILAWTFYYLGTSFQSPLPWSCDGSIDGVRFYLSSDWSKLQSAQLLRRLRHLLRAGAHGPDEASPRGQRCGLRDTLVIAVGNCCTSFFAGFAIFSVLGHMARTKRVPVGNVADSGPGLAFVAYPEALALLPGSAFWSILFFLMLFTLGIDTLFGNIEGILTAILDELPALRVGKRRPALLGALCGAFYLLGLLRPRLVWAPAGVNQFCQDIVDMICRRPPWCSHALGYFKVCWVFFTPCLLLFTLIYTFLDVSSAPLRYGAYEYPAWGRSLGVCMGVLTCLQIPLWAVAAGKNGTAYSRPDAQVPARAEPCLERVFYSLSLTKSMQTGCFCLPTVAAPGPRRRKAIRKNKNGCDTNKATRPNARVKITPFPPKSRARNALPPPEAAAPEQPALLPSPLLGSGRRAQVVRVPARSPPPRLLPPRHVQKAEEAEEPKKFEKNKIKK